MSDETHHKMRFFPLFLCALGTFGYRVVTRQTRASRGLIVGDYRNQISTRTSRLLSTTSGDAAAGVNAAGVVTELSRLEIRVGKIVEIGKHPEADGLYVEKVDLAEPEGPRTIVSGLVQYQTVEQLLNTYVIVLCNLKPRALKGITSAGMLLCSSSADHTKVEPLRPPAGTNVGTLISFQGHKAEIEPPGNRASKAYTKVADDFFVNDDGVATYNGVPFMTPQGPITSALKGKIS